MAFEDVVGKSRLKKLLSNSIEKQKISHAYVFCGDEGIGKKLMANAFAKSLLCGQKERGPCGLCDSCKTFEAGSNPDYIFLTSAAASIGVDEIRQMQSDIRLRPLYSDLKVYIIDNADKMTQQAQNALLKTLEEPPSFVVLILLTSRYDVLIETVKSRVFKLDLERNTNEEVLEVLVSEFPDLKGSEFIVTYADGNIGKALKLAVDENFLKLREEVYEMVTRLTDKKEDNIISIPDFLDKHKNEIHVVLDLFVAFFRDILALKVLSKENILINPDKKDIMIIDSEKLKLNKIIKSIDNIELIRAGLTQNANFALAAEYLTLSLDC